ncbi:MAG: hypothetical protein LUD72_00700, partial [Bacteroidales bacterium]|nr:hypothetical protein [Bacteroidales bacterium]
MAGVVAVGALTAALVAFATIFRDTDSEAAQLKQELKDLEDQIDETSESLEEARAEDDKTIESYRSMADELKDLTSRESLTRAEQERLNKIFGEFSDAGLDIAYESATNSVNKSSEAIDAFCDSLEAETKYYTAVDEYNTLMDERAELEAIAADAEVILSGETGATERQMNKAQKTLDSANADIAALDEQIEAASATMEEYGDSILDSDSEAAQLRDELADLKSEISETTESFEATYQANQDTADSYRSMASEIEELASRTELTRAEQERLNTLCEEFTEAGLDLAYDDVTGSLNLSTDAVYEYCDAMEQEMTYTTAVEEYNALLDERAELEAIVTDAEIIMCGETEATDAEIQAATEAYNDAQAQLEELNGQIDAAADLIDEMGAAMDEQQQDSTDWEASVTDDIQSICDSIIELDQQYDEAYNSAKESLEGQFGLWEDVGEVAITSAEDIMSSLQSQEEYWASYADNIENLNNRQIEGLDELVAAYSDGSMESAGYIASMAAMEDEDLMAMIAQMQNVSDQQDRVATSAAEMSTDYTATVGEMCDAVVEKYEDLDAADQLQEYGMSTMSGYVQGLEDGEADVEGEMLSVSERGQEIFAHSMGINSPSTVYEGFGENTVQGYINGLDGFDTAVQKELDKVSKAVSSWGLSIEVTAKQTGSDTLSEMTDYFSKVPQEIQKYLNTALNNVTSWSASVTSKVGDVGSKIVQSITADFSQIPGKIQTQLTTALNNINSWAASVSSKITETGNNVVNTITTYFSQIPGKVQTQLTNTLNNITSWSTSLQNKISDTGTKAVNSMTSSFTTMTSNVKSQLTAISNYATSWGSSLTTSFTNMGKNVMQGLINGMNSMTSSLYASIKSSLSGMVSQAKRELGISSPSTVMAEEIGRWIPPGIGEGFDDAMPDLIDDVNDGMDGLVDQMQAAVDASTVGVSTGTAAAANYQAYRDSTAYSGGGSQSVDISGTIYTTVELDGEKVGEAQTPIVDRNFGRIDAQKRRGG